MFLKNKLHFKFCNKYLLSCNSLQIYLHCIVEAEHEPMKRNKKFTFIQPAQGVNRSQDSSK